MRRNLWGVLFLVGVGLPETGFAGVIVGNGDDGGDLEGAVALSDGPIVESRLKAREHVQKLGLKGVRGLGSLEDEISKTQLFLAPEDRKANLPQDQGPFHADMRGLVYARTLPSAHASTRFYPSAKTLSADQLVALHVHEALHRALPPAVREDEAKVSEITLAITAPGASRDQVEQTIDRIIPVAQTRLIEPDVSLDDPTYQQFLTPSTVGYSFRTFFLDQATSDQTPRQMHSFHSYLYPFGGTNSPFGLGIEMAFVKSSSAFLAGPLGLSARLRIWSSRSFDVGIWGVAHLNTLSAEEMKNSPFGRDIGTFGISFRKSFKYGYVENLVSLSTPGKSQQAVGLVNYTYDYGTVVQAKIRAGVKLAYVSLGLFGEIHLADYFRVSGGAFGYDSGRYRILSAGPEVTMTFDQFQFGLQGRMLASATNGANFSYLGNLLGIGTAQGGIGASASILF